MTDLLTHLHTRRSIPAPQLGEPGPDAATLADILKIAVRVPDHGKLAPWRFILYRGDGAVRAGAALADLLAGRDPAPSADRLAFERARFTRVPLTIGLVSRAGPHVKVPEWEQQLSAGAVGLNLLHAVQGHGFAAQWITEWPAFDAEAGRLLGLKDGERFAGFVHVGTPKQPPFERDRPDVAALVSEF